MGQGVCRLRFAAKGPLKLGVHWDGHADFSSFQSFPDFLMAGFPTRWQPEFSGIAL